MSRRAGTLPGGWPRARVALLALAALGVPEVANAGAFDQFIGFGDSSMDSGYFRYTSTGGSPGLGGPGSAAALNAQIAATVAAGGSGAFLGPGIVDTVQLATRFGLTALPVTIPGGSGTNYANGSAQTVSTTAGNNYLRGLYNNIPIVTEMSNYLAAVHGVANPNALYMISYGGNDLTWLQTQAPAGLAPQAYLQSFASSLTAGITNLQAAGARTILVLNVYAYARLVGPGGSLTPANASWVSEAATYSADVWSGLHAAGVNFIPADIEGLLRYVSQNPTMFGFTPATALASSPACGAVSALICAPSQLVTPNAEQTYMWSDQAHLSNAGQTIETDYLYNLLTAPSEISMLAESPVWGGLARAATIQQQIEQSGQTRGPGGINVWVGAGAGHLSNKNASNFPAISGVPFGGTIGADYLTPSGLLVGAAISAGNQAQNFSTGGHFAQVDEALSLYAAYRTGPLWGNAVASYDLLQDHVARRVPLGIIIDQNNADTSGHDLALALRGGWDLDVGPIATGPVAGLVLQQVHLNGFSESGTTGFTALSFGSQTRNSAVSQLGWRAAARLGDWRPFAEVGWNHEWAGGNRSVSASILSIAAPAYTVSAVPVASDWGNVSAGATYRINARTSLRGAVSAMFVNPQVASYGGGVTLAVGF
jgi:outer membrane lipase/esterase